MSWDIVSLSPVMPLVSDRDETRWETNGKEENHQGPCGWPLVGWGLSVLESQKTKLKKHTFPHSPSSHTPRVTGSDTSYQVEGTDPSL